MRGHVAGRSPWWAAGLVLCTGLVALAYFVLSRPDSAMLPPPVRETEGSTRASQAVDLLDDLVEGLQSGDRREVVALAAAGDRAARRELAALDSNVEELGITDLSMRYVDENVAASSAGREWSADVEVGWRLDGYDRSTSELEVTMTFRQTRSGTAFVTARGGNDDATPLWLLDRLAVRESRRTLVMAAEASQLARFSGLAGQAARDVRKVLPGWDGDLVIAVPKTQDQLTQALGADQDSYTAIAAVTTPVGGTSGGEAVRIFVNPPVFEPLGKRGAQIVMSHEAAHVATGAAASGMPTWLLEGFADYVALAHVDLPVEVTASQILAQVRREGPPTELPGPSDFQSENSRLGASYEAAWLACRLLAETYGEDALIDFYRAAEREGETGAAFRSVLDTTEADFTRQWRAYLRRLAS